MCNCKSNRPHHIRVQDEQLRKELIEIIMRSPRRSSFGGTTAQSTIQELIANESASRPSVRQLLAVETYKRVREQQPGSQQAIENRRGVSAEDFLSQFEVEPEPSERKK